jgi:uncharacterized sulfatase
VVVPPLGRPAAAPYDVDDEGSAMVGQMSLWVWIAIGLAGPVAGCSDEAGKIRSTRPNVVIVLADDLGWGDLACYGHPKFKTPNIDRLAREGARLTNFYACCPYCAPTRAGLQTGRYPFRCGITGNPTPDQGINELGLPAREITLGEAFRAAGYRTGFIGKWHLGHLPHFRPMMHGYDEYFGILYSNDMRPVELMDGDRVVEYPVVQATLTRRYSERAADFFERNQDRPFLLILAHAMPHKPLAASEEYYRKSGAGLYGDVMAELDWSVGQILERLSNLGLDDRTLVWFASDNGPWYGGSSGGLRGMKGQSWEGGIRVPLIARWPERIPAGHVSHELAIIMDLFTTSLVSANIPVPTDRVIDGKDILPVLTSSAPSPHEAVFSTDGRRLRSIRSGKWKLHVLPPAPREQKVWRPNEPWTDPRAPDGVRLLAPFEQYHPSAFPGLLTGDPPGPMALFDLQADPGEQHNVAKANPEVVRRLKALFDRINRDVPSVDGKKG